MDEWHGLETLTQGNRNSDKWHKDGWNCDSTLFPPQFVKLHVLEFRLGICAPTLRGPVKRQAELSLKLHIAGCMQLVGGELYS